MRDESLFPPRCCRQSIDLELVRDCLGEELATLFEMRELEMNTPNRVYCPIPTCSAFIPPNYDDYSYAAIVECPDCYGAVCSECKGAAHLGDCELPQDTELVTAGLEAGMQRCDCGFMIELESGCYHIRCRCGREFCYLCGSPWKTCHCRNGDEDYIVQQAGLGPAGYVSLRSRIGNEASTNTMIGSHVHICSTLALAGMFVTCVEICSGGSSSVVTIVERSIVPDVVIIGAAEHEWILKLRRAWLT